MNGMPPERFLHLEAAGQDRCGPWGFGGHGAVLTSSSTASFQSLMFSALQLGLPSVLLKGPRISEAGLLD